MGSGVDNPALLVQAARTAHCEEILDLLVAAFLLALILLAVLIPFALVSYFRHWLLKPLEQVADFARAVIAGERERRLSLSDPDQLATIAGGFNTLLDEGSCREEADPRPVTALQKAYLAFSEAQTPDRLAERLLEQAGALVSFTAGSVYLLDEASPRATHGEVPPPAPEIRRQGARLLSPGEGEKDHPQMVVPLQTTQAWLGLLCLKAATDHMFDAQDLATIEALAARAAPFFHNLFLVREARYYQRRLDRLSQDLVSAQEQERRRLAELIHDGPGQSLTALLLGLGLMDDENFITPAHVAEMEEMAGEAVDELQRIVRNLHPPALDEGTLAEAINQLCTDLATGSDFTVTCNVDEVSPLPETVAVSLYRLVQQALATIAHEDDARSAAVTLSRQDGLVRLTVGADSRAINTDLLAGDQELHAGLRRVSRQLQLLGGKLAVAPRPEGGMMLTATVQI